MLFFLEVNNALLGKSLDQSFVDFRIIVVFDIFIDQEDFVDSQHIDVLIMLVNQVNPE